MSLARIGRREFIRATSLASAGLVLGFVQPGCRRTKGASSVASPLGPFVSVETDGMVTIWVAKTEMGQGVRTALSMIVAEELDADWKRVRVRQALLDPKYGSQDTGGSGAVRDSWMPLRRAGAAARMMLVSAAAARLGAPAADCAVSQGVIRYGSRTIGFGDVAAAAAKLPAPKDVELKNPAAFRIVGRSLRRVDNEDVVRGRATFGSDVKIPGMLYAAVRRAPVFGASVARVDEAKARAIPGVRAIVPIRAIGAEMPWSGVGVVANSTWAAFRGRDALGVDWQGGATGDSTEGLRQAMRAALEPGKAIQVFNVGNVDAAIAGAALKVDATYELPFLAHATMEPQVAVASVTEAGAEIWAPTQFPGRVRTIVSEALGLRPDQVTVHVTLAGGGFGRRILADYALEAALISKAARAPVKVQWSREDDFTHDYYRPPSIHHIVGGLDARGNSIAYRHVMASPTVGVFHGTSPESDFDLGGVDDMRHLFPNFRVEYAYIRSAVPRGWWRSVDFSATTFATQSFLDEMAHAAGRDPIALRLDLLARSPLVARGPRSDVVPYDPKRLRQVIELAAEKSGWGSPVAAGRGRGFACQYSFDTYAAEVAEASRGPGGTIRVHRVTCAIDCGIAINPDGIAAEVEGGILFGLSATLGAITVQKGVVEQTNFDAYPLLRIAEAPEIDVHIVPSTVRPTGVGEPPVPPIAPAVANAFFAATGRRLRRLPFDLEESKK